MAAKVLVVYKKPADPAAFDKYYFETHVPKARKLPGLKEMTFNAAPVAAFAGEQPHLICELIFDDMAALQNALGSPEGQAVAADVPNYAKDPTILIYEVRID